MTALFWVLAAGLAAIGIGFLAWPLLRAAPPTRLDRRAATLAAHRARLAEIDAGDEGSAADAATGCEAREDVARSLLRDLDPEDRPAAGSSSDSTGDSSGPASALPRRGAAVALGIAVPLLAAGVYALLGEQRGLDPPVARNGGPRADALGHAVVQLLADAEALARANGDRLEGEPARLVEQALVLAPDHRKALWFAAIAALHEDRAEDARTRLGRLRELGPLEGEEAQMFDRLMKEAAARLRDP